MPIVADAAVAIRGDLAPYLSDLNEAKGPTQALGVELRKALSIGSLAAQGPNALVAGLAKARTEADSVTAAIKKMAAAGTLPAAEARQYADILDEIGIEADQTASELRTLQKADPRFNTPALQQAAREIDHVGDEAKGTANELNKMKGVRADTHLERLAQQAKESSKALDQTGRSAGGIVSKLNSVKGALAGIGLAIGAQQVVSFFGDTIQAASDLGETVSKVGAIFGKEAIPQMEAWAETAAESFGQSKQQALDAASTFAIFGKSAGLAGDDLIGFSKELTVLASDFASFFNTSPEDAITAIGAALRGESEPIRRYGVLLDEATLRQRALKLGIIETTTQALTPQQRVLAAQAEILAQTSDAQGDFIRTSDGLANTQRKLEAKFHDLQVEIGEKLLPVMLKLVNFAADDLIPVMGDVIPPLIDLAGVVGDLGRHAIPLLVGVLGIRLVAAFTAAKVAGVASALAIKAAWGAALFGIPLLAEGLNQAGQGAHDLFGELIHGKEGFKVLQGLTELVENEKFANRLNEWGVSVEEFAEVLEAADGDAEAAFRSIEENAGDAGKALAEQFASASEDATERFVRGWGPNGPVDKAMDSAKTTVGDATDDMAGDVGDMPGEMADELLANQFELTDAIDELVRFMEEALTPAEEGFQAAAFLASKAYRDGIESDKPAVVRKTEELRDAALAALSGSGVSAQIAWNGGAALINAWVGSMEYTLDTRLYHFQTMVKRYSDVLGSSLPTAGPLQHPERGGLSIAEAWTEKGLVAGLLAGQKDVEAALPTLGTWAGALPTQAPAMASSMVGTGAGVTINNTWELSIGGVPYKFETRDDFIKALDELSVFGDGRLQ